VIDRENKKEKQLSYEERDSKDRKSQPYKIQHYYADFRYNVLNKKIININEGKKINKDKC